VKEEAFLLQRDTVLFIRRTASVGEGTEGYSASFLSIEIDQGRIYRGGTPSCDG